MKSWRRFSFWSLVAIAGCACVGASYRAHYSAENKLLLESSFARAESQRLQQQAILFTERAIPAGLPFGALLQGLGINPVSAARIIASAQPVFDLRHLRAGNSVSVGRSILGDLREIRYRVDTSRILRIAPQGTEFHSEIQTLPSKTGTVAIRGEIHDSLFQGILDAGEKPELAMRLADIFCWDLDFYVDPRPGDTFRVLVEKTKFGDNGAAVYGRILAAEYDNAGRPFRAILFHDPTGAPAYYTPEGKSMKKAFLHSPLKFAASVTSHFSLHRFHPILKEYRPHLGVDYAAPTGTPVQTIGDGRVIFAGPKGSDGNLVQVQHSNGFVTYYMHLSRILVRNGQRVDQGQSIGLVGMTGLATGPHLDFRVQRSGQFLNFERLPLSPTDPVSPHDMDEFASSRDRVLAEMPAAPEKSAALAANGRPISRVAGR